MKKNILASLLLAGTFAIVSCNKETKTENVEATTVEEVQPAEADSTSTTTENTAEEQGDVRNFSGDKTVKALFNLGLDTPQVVLEYDGKKETLNQTEAWAKGAAYANADESVKFEVKSNPETQETVATLTEGGKTFQLKQD